MDSSAAFLWLVDRVGWAEAKRRVHTEAVVFAVSDESEAAVRHAIANYQRETGHSPRTHKTNQKPIDQEGLPL